MMMTARSTSVAIVTAVIASWVRVENSIPKYDSKKYRATPTANHNHHSWNTPGASTFPMTRLVNTAKPASAAGQ
jgi:hypothetical protein